MKVKMIFNNKGYIQSFCTIGNLEGSTEYEVDEEHFWANVAGYRLLNGELIFDSSYKKKAEEKLKAEEDILELKKKLSATDYKALKFAEGWIAAEDYEDILNKRKAWRDEINELEAKIFND